mgnify:CR=1 FL=1
MAAPLAQADLITLHTPKTKETYNMIAKEQLYKCKRGVRIVNAARGGLVNEQDLADALAEGQVAAAAIDVFDKEPSYNKAPGEQDFDTDFHEAIALIPAPSEELKGKILDCVQTGYMLNEKVIRHAKVAVAQ